MRVLTYNVRSLRDDPAAVAAVTRAVRPDVVCVQEAPRFLRWRSKRAALARESGLVVADPSLRVGGLMLMVAHRVTARPLVAERLSSTPRLHQRALVAARLSVEGMTCTVASLHLGLDATERRRHADEVAGLLAAYDDPVVLAGDVNETPGEPAWQALAGRWPDAWAAAGRGDGHTYSALHPHKRIDAVFADPRLEVVSCEAVDRPEVARASDHRPVLAELRPR